MAAIHAALLARAARLGYEFIDDPSLGGPVHQTPETIEFNEIAA